MKILSLCRSDPASGFGSAITSATLNSRLVRLGIRFNPLPKQQPSTFGNGKNPASAPPQPGCCTVAPLRPQRVQRSLAQHVAGGLAQAAQLSSERFVTFSSRGAPEFGPRPQHKSDRLASCSASSLPSRLCRKPISVYSINLRYDARAYRRWG